MTQLELGFGVCERDDRIVCKMIPGGATTPRRRASARSGAGLLALLGGWAAALL